MGDPQIAVDCQRQPHADRETVYRRDHGFGQFESDAGNRVGEIVRADHLAGLADLFHIGAGAKRAFAVAAHDDRANPIRCFHFLPNLAETPFTCNIECVEALGAIERHDVDAVAMRVEIDTHVAAAAPRKNSRTLPAWTLP